MKFYNITYDYHKPMTSSEISNFVNVHQKFSQHKQPYKWNYMCTINLAVL